MLMTAMANRKSADALAPIIRPTAFNEFEARGERRGRERDADRQRDHHGRVAERKEEADPDRALALLHQFAGDVVDRGDVIGVDRMAQAERVGEQRRTEQDRLAAQGDERPKPDEKIAADQNGVDGDQPAARISATLVHNA